MYKYLYMYIMACVNRNGDLISLLDFFKFLNTLSLVDMKGSVVSPEC